MCVCGGGGACEPGKERENGWQGKSPEVAGCGERGIRNSQRMKSSDMARQGIIRM